MLNFSRKLNLPFGLWVALLLCSALIFTPNTLGANRRSNLDADMSAKYKAAAPMNHTVKITRSGSVLKFDYELVGADGRRYDLWKIRDQSRPAFSVYHGNVKVGGGAFEFG